MLAAFDTSGTLELGPADDEALALVRAAFGAARGGGERLLRQLLERGVPANVYNEKGDSLLLLASYHGHLAVARVLLEHGADPALCNDRGQHPLAGAAFKGDADMARLLLEQGAHVDEPMRDGKTALMFAAMFDRVVLVELLLEHGADPARREAGGLNAFELANAMGAKAAAERLAAAAS